MRGDRRNWRSFWYRRRFSDRAICSRIVFVLFFVSVPVYSLGGSVAAPGSSWIEAWDVPRAIMGALFLVAAFFVVREMNGNRDARTETTATLSKIFQLIREDEKEKAQIKADLSELKGRCDALTCGDKKGGN